MSNYRDDVEKTLVAVYGVQAAKEAMQNQAFKALLNQCNNMHIPTQNLVDHWGKKNELSPLSEQNLNDPQILQSKINEGSEAAIAYENMAVDKPEEVKNLSNKEKEKFEKAREDAEDITVPRQQAQNNENCNDELQSPLDFNMKLTY
jgi:hypothetical protein